MYETKVVDIGVLVEDNRNPRKHSQRNISTIKSSLLEFGQVEPLVVQKSTMIVIGGNGRLQAMKELGWGSAVVAFVDVDDVQARALSITLNRAGELASWDSARLVEAVSFLNSEDFDLTTMGWDSSELESHIDSIVDGETEGKEDKDNNNPGRTVRFSFGDLSANVSSDVYDLFMLHIDRRRSLFPMLDDILRDMVSR